MSSSRAPQRANSFKRPSFRSTVQEASRPSDVAVLTRASVRGTVLVVEDDQDSLEMMRRMLEALGARVVLAADGEVALRLLGGAPPDLVLCDLMLPLVDGFRFVTRLRADARWRRTPVVAVTGRGFEADYARTWETGFDGHVVKPIDMDTLAHVVERYLPRRGRTTRRNGSGPRR